MSPVTALLVGAAAPAPAVASWRPSRNLLTRGKLRYKIGTDIKDIKNRINEVSERRGRYELHVSLTPNMEKIFKNMLRQFGKEKYHNINEATWGEAQLINELKEFFQDKSY
ncbi:hypothetical protein E2562_017361 [Oryza meyeriana var. granulata]|uniref:Uncharacterized protein n=1 Tax=Oryza meyeriana var. granulata TaxID=110450 RepID=A0A6G1D4U4_9ORYZ|nr:hypothetical protein E2562_017361 [Oryza meyeriana var. granulata]